MGKKDKFVTVKMCDVFKYTWYTCWYIEYCQMAEYIYSMSCWKQTV